MKDGPILNWVEVSNNIEDRNRRFVRRINMTEACFLPACRLVTFASSALEAADAYVSRLGRWVKV